MWFYRGFRNPENRKLCAECEQIKLLRIMVQSQFVLGFTGSPCDFPRRQRAGGVHCSNQIKARGRLAGDAWQARLMALSLSIGL
jgi:hypothetical protein